MSLKIIPVEPMADNERLVPQKKNTKKNFNPGEKLVEKKRENDAGLRSMCLRLVHFINRGSRFSYEQVDDLIINMQRSILGLQKKKQDILKNRSEKKKKK